jgi:signal transduction histidine kinase
MLSRAILFFLLTIAAPRLYGQFGNIDSLRQLLKNESSLPVLSDIHTELAISLYDQNVVDAFREATQAYELAVEGNYQRGIKRALPFVGFKYFLDGNNARAMELFRQSDAIDSKIDPITTGYTWILMANILRIKAEYDSSEVLLAKAIGVLENTSQQIYLAYAYKNLGLTKQSQYKLKDAEIYLKKSLEIRRGIKRRKIGVTDSYLALGSLEISRSNYLEAKRYFDEACQSVDPKNQALQIHCAFNYGTVQYKIGNFEEALKQLFKANELLKDQTDTYKYAETLERIGDVYSEMDQQELALKYLYEALAGFEKLDAPTNVAATLSEIAWMYKSQLNFSVALDFLERSQRIRESIHDSYGLSNCFNIRGLIYFQQKKYAESLSEMNKSLELRRQLGHREGVADVLFNKSLVFEEQGDLKKAMENQLQALQLEYEFASDQGIGISLNGIGELLVKMRDYAGAEKYLRQANEKALKTGSKFLLRNNYKYFSDLYEQKGDFKLALKYRKSYDEIKDSVYSLSNGTKIAEMQALYQLEKKNQELALKEVQLKLQEDKLQQKNIIIISITFGAALISVLAFVIFRYLKNIRKANKEITEQKEEIQAQSEELVEANQTIGQINRSLETKVDERTSELKQAYKELDTFFYRSSHDFRRPLTTFLGLAEVAKVTVREANALELFDKVKETAIYLDKMLFKLQSISDLGAQQLVYKEVFLKELVNEVLDNFRDVISKKEIRVSVNINAKTSFYSYPAMVKIIIENLVENAVHFSRAHDPTIDLKITLVDNELVIVVDDNGQGIDKEYQPRIFEMYFRANQHSKGNGLGLYIVKKASEKLSGRIHFSSKLNDGSSFSVYLPSAEVHTIL